MIDPSGHMFTTTTLNYDSTVNDENAYVSSAEYQQYEVTQTSNEQEDESGDCGGTGCVAGNYVPVTSSSSYSTASGGSSLSGPHRIKLLINPSHNQRFKF